jgi:type I restriction enzyme S subunit
MSKWKTVLLSNIGEITTGNTPKTSDLENYETNDIPFLKPSDFNTDSIDLLRTEFYISEKARNKARILPMGSIAVTCIGIIGKTKILNMECAFNQQINAIIPKNDNYNRYIAYAISFQKDLLQTQANAAVVPIINKSNVSKILIPLPPIETQRKIADNLDKVNHTIDLCKAILEKLDLLVKSRFVEMFGDVLTNSHKLPIEKMCERYYLKAGITTSADDIHIRSDKYTIPCYGGNGIRGYVDYVSYDGQYPIIGRQGALCGNVQLAIGKFHATEHAVLVKMLKKDNVVWVYYMLQMMNLNQYHTGAAQPGLAVKNLNTLNVIVVPYNHQKQFADFVEQTEKSKATIKQVKEKAETLKEKLMQDYFG